MDAKTVEKLEEKIEEARLAIRLGVGLDQSDKRLLDGCCPTPIK